MHRALLICFLMQADVYLGWHRSRIYCAPTSFLCALPSVAIARGSVFLLFFASFVPSRFIFFFSVSFAVHLLFS